MTDEEKARYDIEHAIGKLEPIELTELSILTQGGVTAADVEHALDAWARARYRAGGSDWGYLRAVMLRRAADRMLLLKQAAGDAA